MIQAALIADELKYRFPRARIRVSNRLARLDRPLLYTPEEKPRNDRVYICSANELSADALLRFRECRSLFLCAGDSDIDLSLVRGDICILPEWGDVARLMNFIQRLYDRFDEWDQKLQSAIESNASSDALLALAGQMLQNPAFLCTERLHIVAHSAETELSSLYYKVFDGLGRRLDDLSRLSVKAPALFHADAGSCLITAFEAANERRYLVVMSAERPFYGCDETVCEQLCGYLAIQLSGSAASGRPPRTNAAIDAIEPLLATIRPGEEVNARTAAALSAYGWQDSHTYRCICAEPRSRDRRPSTLRAVCDRLEACAPNSCARTEDGCIIWTLNEGEAMRHPDDAKERVISALKSCDLCGGAGERFSGIAGIGLSAAQAMMAKRQAEREGETVLACYSDYACACILDTLLGQGSARLFAIRAVREMYDYDRLHGTEFFATAQCYMKNGWNALRTSGALYIHRSTFLHRLERMKELFGVDFANADSFSALMLSMKLFEMQSNV